MKDLRAFMWLAGTAACAVMSLGYPAAVGVRAHPLPLAWAMGIGLR
jgi:hypothetical protein